MTNIPRKFADTRIWSSPSVMNAAGLWKGIVRVTLGCLSRVPTSPRSQLQPACHHRHHLQPACHHQLGIWETVSHPGSSGQHYYERRVQHPTQYPVYVSPPYPVSVSRVSCLLSISHTMSDGSSLLLLTHTISLVWCSHNIRVFNSEERCFIWFPTHTWIRSCVHSVSLINPHLCLVSYLCLCVHS